MVKHFVYPKNITPEHRLHIRRVRLATKTLRIVGTPKMELNQRQLDILTRRTVLGCDICDNTRVLFERMVPGYKGEENDQDWMSLGIPRAIRKSLTLHANIKTLTRLSKVYLGDYYEEERMKMSQEIRRNSRYRLLEFRNIFYCFKHRLVVADGDARIVKITCSGFTLSNGQKRRMRSYPINRHFDSCGPNSSLDIVLVCRVAEHYHRAIAVFVPYAVASICSGFLERSRVNFFGIS
jgi:hypothetical protein